MLDLIKSIDQSLFDPLKHFAGKPHLTIFRHSTGRRSKREKQLETTSKKAALHLASREAEVESKSYVCIPNKRGIQESNHIGGRTNGD